MKPAYFFRSLFVTSVLGLTACEDHRDSPNAAFPERIEFVSERLYPEGIAYSSQLGKFLVTSIPQGKIGSVATDGQYEDLLTAPELIAAIGMKVAGSRVFVCNSDGGTSTKSTPAGTFQTAELLVFNLNTRQLERRTDLDALLPAADRNFANDVTLAPDGTAYVTDSFSPVIYSVAPDGTASILVRDDVRFSGGAAFGLNGIVYHTDGYLIVANVGQQKLYKVDLQRGNTVSEITGTGPLAGDGLSLLNNDLYATRGNRVAQVRTADNWQTASIVKFDEGVYTGATTNVAVNNQIYSLNALIGDTTNIRNFSIQRFR